MLVLLTGLPGTGKSTVARMLAERTQGIVINSDSVRRELFSVVRTYSSEETRQVNGEIERRVREDLAQKKTVIVDALFTRQKARDEIKALVSALGDEFMAVLVTALEGEVKARLEDRPKTSDPSEATYTTYLDRRCYFEPVVGDHMVVDNSTSLTELSRRVAEVANAL